MANEEQDEATSLYISFVMSTVIAQKRCTTALLVALDGGDNNSNIVSFDFRVTAQSPIHCIQARLVRLSTELSRGLNPTASNPILVGLTKFG